MEAPLLLPVSTATGASSISVDETAVSFSSPPPSSSPSTQSIVLRLLAVLAVACASLFARHEASKGFAIDVVNGAPRDSAAGRRFHLFYVSNGRAERVIQYASRGVERALFPDASFPRKRVTRVTVRMAGHNLTAEEDATVDAAPAAGEYVISLSPGLLVTSGTGDDAVRRAVARMWLWDGRGAVPARVTESMVEYLVSGGVGGAELATTSQPPTAGQEEDEQQQCMSARFLRHLEQRRGGFVARLNHAMKDRWSAAAVDAALGAPARPVCAAYLATGTTPRGSSVAM